jgi:hypothetical protein
VTASFNTSTGAAISIWRDPGEPEVFHAGRLDDPAGEVQSCLAVDLFEVIADLGGLDLEDGIQAAEAMGIAARALMRLPVDREPSFREPN